MKESNLLFKVFDKTNNRFMKPGSCAIKDTGKLFKKSTGQTLDEDNYIICYRSRFRAKKNEKEVTLFEHDVVDLLLVFDDNRKTTPIRAVVSKTELGFFSLITDRGEVPEYNPELSMAELVHIGNALTSPELAVTYDAEAIKNEILDAYNESREKEAKET